MAVYLNRLENASRRSVLIPVVVCFSGWLESIRTILRAGTSLFSRRVRTTVRRRQQLPGSWCSCRVSVHKPEASGFRLSSWRTSWKRQDGLLPIRAVPARSPDTHVVPIRGPSSSRDSRPLRGMAPRGVAERGGGSALDGSSNDGELPRVRGPPPSRGKRARRTALTPCGSFKTDTEA